MKMTKLSYWKSCYLSIANHIWENTDINRKIHMQKQITDKMTIANDKRHSFILHPKFIEKYFEDIYDHDVIKMILADNDVSDAIKVYLKMREHV